MYVSDTVVIGAVAVTIFSSSIIAAIITLVKIPIYMPKGLTLYMTSSKTIQGSYVGSSSSYVSTSGGTQSKYLSPEYMLKKGKFHKVKSKMHKRKKEHQLDFAEIERNNFVGYEYLNQPYLFACRKA